MKSLHLIISGKVQGVFFRKSAKIEADRLEIVGWIKNVDDGSVEVTVGGDEEKLKEFVVWCKKGPPFAMIESVEEDWKEEESAYDAFEIIG